METYACADCGAEFTDGNERDDHFMSPACRMVGRHDAVGDLPRNARIWIYENDSPVKLTLKPGQTLKWSKSRATEEGWSSSSFTLTWDGHELVQEWFTDGVDCDGRLSQSGRLITTPDQFSARPHMHYNANAEWVECADGIRFPEWHKAGRDRQRDYFAEAAGY